MAKQVPVWHGIFYKKGTLRYLSSRAAGAHGNRPGIRLKKTSKQPSRNLVIPQMEPNACWLDPKASQMTSFHLNRQRAGSWLSINSEVNPLQAGLSTRQSDKIAFSKWIPI